MHFLPEKSQQLYKIDQIFILVPLQFFSENSSFPQLLYKTIVYRHDLLRPFSAHFLKYGYCFLKSAIIFIHDSCILLKLFHCFQKSKQQFQKCSILIFPEDTCSYPSLSNSLFAQSQILSRISSF